MIKTLNLSISILQTVNIFVIIATQAKSNQEALDQWGILRQRNFVVFMCLSLPRSIKNVHSAVQMLKMFTILCECLQLSTI